MIANENAGNSTYTIPIDIPKGEHMMTVYAHNPIGWSTNNEETPQKFTGKSSLVLSHLIKYTNPNNL